VKGWETTKLTQPEENKVAIEWFESKLNQSILELEDHFTKFRISDALHSLYKLVWDDFCSWYLEIIKPEFGKPIDEVTYQKTISFFESILKLLHPFMPFLTEELWHELIERKQEDCLIVAKWLKPNSFSEQLISHCEMAFDVVTQVRNVRNSKGLSPKESLSLSVSGSAKEIEQFNSVIKKLANLKSIDSVSEKPANATSFMIGTKEFHIPLEGKVDAAKEKQKQECVL